MGNTNVQTFFHNERNLRMFIQNISPFTVDLMQHTEYLSKHYNTLFTSDRKKQLLGSNNLINFIVSDENLSNLLKVSELKEKLLVGITPKKKTQSIKITSFVNNIQKPYNAPSVK